MSRSGSIIVLILIILMSVAAGCGRESGEKKPGDNNQSNKAPRELKSLGSDLDTVIAELDKKIKARSGGAMQQEIQLNPQAGTGEGESTTGQSAAGQPPQQQGGQSSSTQKEKQDNQDEGESKGEGGENSGEGGESSGQDEQSQDSQEPSNGKLHAKTGQTGQQQGATNPPTGAASDWQKEFTSMRKIHESWNGLMPEAAEAGMGMEARSQFTSTLEQLTQAITARQMEDSMTAALELYKNYAELTRYFPNAVPPEFHRLKYEVMAAVYESSRKNWSKAEEHVPKMQEQWLYLGAKAKDTDSKLLSRTEFSIMDLQNAVKTRQTELIMIKGEITMTNLSNLQNKISSQSGGGLNQSPETG